MLKRRIVANIVVRNGVVVQSIGFNKFLPIGKPGIAIEFLNSWGIDEIILTDITATTNNLEPDYEMIREASSKGFVPLAVSGGIKNSDHIKRLLQCGADKISINSAALDNPKFVTDASKIFGDQCVLVSVDAKLTENGYEVFDYRTRKTNGIKVVDWVKECQENGAGEIFLQSVDRDGTYQGFDIELIESVCKEVRVPVICCGGARHSAHFIEVFSKTKVSAACAANMFHFTEHSVNTTKHLISGKISVRIETHADYSTNLFDSQSRLVKKDDAVLEAMLFTRIEKEVI